MGNWRGSSPAWRVSALAGKRIIYTLVGETMGVRACAECIHTGWEQFRLSLRLSRLRSASLGKPGEVYLSQSRVKRASHRGGSPQRVSTEWEPQFKYGKEDTYAGEGWKKIWETSSIQKA